ncbi:hypothetical protein QQ045_016016 [Rhodiola kirilowii]
MRNLNRLYLQYIKDTNNIKYIHRVNIRGNFVINYFSQNHLNSKSFGVSIRDRTASLLSLIAKLNPLKYGQRRFCSAVLSTQPLRPSPASVDSRSDMKVLKEFEIAQPPRRPPSPASALSAQPSLRVVRAVRPAQHSRRPSAQPSRRRLVNVLKYVAIIDLGFTSDKAKSVYGKEGHQGITLVKFPGDRSGLKEAIRLAEYLEKEKHGRKSWAHVEATTTRKDDVDNPSLVNLDEKSKEKRRIL